MRKVLIISAFLLAATNITADDFVQSVLKQITFSKKDFADTIKVRVVGGIVFIPVEIEGTTRRFPSTQVGSLTVNDLYISTACHSLLMGSAPLKHASLLIDAPKRHFVFLPHDGQKAITVGNKDINDHFFLPAEPGDPNGVLTVVVREGSNAYLKGVRTGDYLVEANGIPITDFCTFSRMERSDRETPMKFRSPDGREKQVALKSTF